MARFESSWNQDLGLLHGPESPLRAVWTDVDCGELILLRLLKTSHGCATAKAPAELQASNLESTVEPIPFEAAICS